MASLNTKSPDRPVERFKPTGGLFVGYAGLACALFAVGYVALFVHTATGLSIALGAVFFGILTWVTQIRPRATAYPRHVVLKNALRDAHVPYTRVDEIGLGQTLNVWVGDVRYVCIGIGNSIRAELKSRRRRETTLGTSRMSELTLMAERASTDERAVSYQNFVVTRLEELVDQAKRDARRDAAEAGGADADEQVPPARHVVAWPVVAALAVTGLAFVLSLVF